MSAWYTLTVADVQKKLSLPEYAAYSNPALTDPASVATLITKVTNEVRGYVEICPRNTTHMDVEGTIPNRLVDAALAIIAFRYITTVLSLPVDEKSGAYVLWTEAKQLMRDVANGKFAIDLVDQGIPENVDVIPTPSFSKERRHFRQRQEDGI